jgi:glycyl-tRNA synthetase
MENLIDKIVSLCKRRGFVFPGSEIYGGLANSWDYGPLGTELKNNIKQLWWKKFVQSRDDMVGIDASLIMNTNVWEASGHLKEFSDPLIECKNCHERFRADSIDADLPCHKCGVKGQFTEAKQFNLMLKTFLGPAEGKANEVYFRPETAQAMFVDFKNVLDTSRKTLPFGIAQTGKAFRNEITPGNFIFRTREFEQMEIEYFIREEDWEKYFEYWRKEMIEWIKELGVDIKNIHENEISDKERAHYSKRTIDFDYDFPFGQKELYGLAYRTDFDLKNHFKEPPYKEEGVDAFYPHVIEPTWGVDRSVLVVLLEAYREEDKRVVLKLPPKLAPYKAAVFPLLANKPELVKLARKIYDDLREDMMVSWDDRGNIGKRYYSQDEIGTPYCITVDFDSLEKNDVTIRDRDTMKQERVKIDELPTILRSKLI